MFYGTELIIVMLPQRVLLVFDICLVSCEVDVNAVGIKLFLWATNVSVLLPHEHRGRANSCGLCQLMSSKPDPPDISLPAHVPVPKKPSTSLSQQNTESVFAACVMEIQQRPATLQ